MKRVTRVNPGFVLIVASALAGALVACVPEGDEAPPLGGALGQTQAGGAAGMGGSAGGGAAGSAGAGTAGQGGSGGAAAGAGGAGAGGQGTAGTGTLPDAGDAG